ncbi:TIGR03086 family protein [Nonomuraea turkmeniaca]|uniref:TIGR03086 family protein n=1 Tax=Nonomuraea turkmeniaca TaxID=103838 RepID=A0A5S4FL79_9ACTN|nr:TIGR03086 family metal-binding protein [Nonomuraea turkmeniaca]TMR21403.1 TIGR03086 family protein [Nonomuraea turkmeniaca]
MREELLPMLRGAADRTIELVRNVPEEQFELPTPCVAYDVKELINHMEWGASLFESVAGGGGFLPPKEYTGDFRERVERMLDAWESPQAWEGVSEAMGGLPKAVLAHMALTDLVAHGWDLAKATGRDYAAAEETAARLLAFARDMAPMGRRQGAFGDEIVVPDDASTLERFLGVIGRDPAWKP